MKSDRINRINGGKDGQRLSRQASKGISVNPVNSVSSPVLVKALLRWFTSNARDLPWRRTLDPYAIWVSEIMLQQTQVKTVIPYWERWMRELSTIESLAIASTEKIHKLWEGLGYYTRVRNMQKAARVIVEKHGGEFPRTFDDVLALPGIGRYTAGAICSIAFNQPTPILDGNVIRVLARVFGVRENVREKGTNAQLWNLAHELVGTAKRGCVEDQPQPLRASKPLRLVEDDTVALRVSGACSALNQSLMELGATVCTPRQPRCEVCPLARSCFARKNGCAESLPNLGERVVSTARRFVACVIEHNGSFLLRQRPAGVVNAHLWEFPNIEVPLKAPAERARERLETELGCTLQSVTPLATVKHTITRYRITLEALRGELNGTRPRPGAGEWIPGGRIDRLPFASAHRRIWAAARKHAADPTAH